MQVTYIFKSLGLFLAIFSTTMLPPVLVALIYAERTIGVFFMAALVLFALGMLMWIPVRNKTHEPRVKESFFIVCLFWVALCLAGALPFLLITSPQISLADAVFESVSGITATGATVLTGLDFVPKSILYYRQQLQFLGGMGIILLAVAVLPALGIGGMQLFKAEYSGPAKENKLTPRLAQSAKSIWLIYFGLTFFCAISYWAAGMDLFDAVSFSFSTVSTGGYAPHDASLGFFNSNKIQLIAVFFMLLGGANFSLHVIFVSSATIRHYLKDAEFKLYTGLLLMATVLVTVTLYHHNVYANLEDTLVSSLFHVTSLFTTTGFSSGTYTQWPLFLPTLLLLGGTIGGCAGSTSGGIKIMRLLLLVKQGIREISLLVHPNAKFVIKFGHTPLSNRIVSAVWGYLATYFALFGLFFILLLATGLDFVTAYSSTAASLSNIGPGLGGVASNYQDINVTAKWIISAAMLIGRLELFTVLVLLSPAFWRS